MGRTEGSQEDGKIDVNGGTDVGEEDDVIVALDRRNEGVDG